jgi:AsmA protein
MDLKLGFELARDKAAPIRLALKSRLTASADALKLANVDLKVDDSRLTGGIDIHNFASPALRFDLTLDRIDLDRYLGGGTPAAKPASASKPAAGGTEPVELPLSTLRGLDVNGKFQIGELKAIGLRSSEVQIRLAAKNGLITLGPNAAKLYSGRYRGETQLDVRGKTPLIRLDEKLEQVQVGPLLKDMQLFDNYTGTGNISVKLAAQGFDADQVKRSLGGTAAIAFRDGRIEGVDLNKVYQAIRDKGNALDKLFKVVPQAGDFTKFGEITASFQIANGVASNRDLTIRAGELLATGQGTANLVSEQLDYRLVLANAQDAGKKCKTIPVKIEGKFEKPSYLPAVDEILQCQAQKAVEKELQKGLERLFQPKKKK